MKERGIIPDLIAGHDIGEYAALHSFGGLNFPDGLYFLSKYASFYEELLQTVQVSGLLVRGMASDDLQKVCKDASDSEHTAKIAIYQSPIEHHVMGHMQAIDRVRNALSNQAGIKVAESDVERGLHSALMDPVAAQLKLYSEKIDFKAISVPLITNADAKIIERADDVKTAALKQIHSPVLWSSIIDALKDYDMIIQVGAGTHILEGVKAYYPDKNYFSVNKLEDIAMLESLVASATQNNDTDET